MGIKKKLNPSGVISAEVECSERLSVATFAKVNSRSARTIVLPVFILVFSWISITSFQQKSPTVDEPVHLLSGYAALKWRDFRANPEHPPLAKALAAVPLLFLEIKDPRPSNPYWDLVPADTPKALHTVKVAAQMFFIDNDAETLFFYSKLMMIGVACLLGVFVYNWARDLFGLMGAIAAIFIYMLEPNILAHAQLVHTDLPFSLFFFISSYFFWRALCRLTIANLIFASIFFGLAVITKHAYVVLFLTWLILGLLRIFSSQPQEVSIGRIRQLSTRWSKAAALGAIFACALGAAYVLIWAVYGFSFHATPGGKLALPIEKALPQSPAIKTLVSFLTQYQLLPEAWIYGQLHVFTNLSRDSYLLGQTSLGNGSWLYFPIAFGVKTPVPLLILLVVTVVLWVRANIRPPAPLLVPVLVYFSLAVWSGINIGLRHILPIYPFLIVLLGGTAAVLWQSSARIQQGAVALLGAWYLMSTLTTFPNYLAFFNELVGGSKNGHKILLDSNLDWGQDLKGLKRWMDNNDVKKIQFLYFGFHDAAAPRRYGIDALHLPGSWVDAKDIATEKLPLPNFLAVSTNHLYGYSGQGGDLDFVRTLRHVHPVAAIGYSIKVYQMDAAIEQFRTIIQSNPASAENHYHLANLLQQQGKRNEAIDYYRRAIAINPVYTEAHNRLGVALAKEGSLSEAVSHLRKVLQLGPVLNRSETQYRLALVLAKQGSFTEAADLLNEVVKAEPNFPRAYYQLGLIFFIQGEVDKAIKSLQKALSVDPGYAEAHVSLARGLASQGRTGEAMSHYEEALRLLKSRNQIPSLR
jgi:Tfp pilus assembly protein PilF